MTNMLSIYARSLCHVLNNLITLDQRRADSLNIHIQDEKDELEEET